MGRQDAKTPRTSVKRGTGLAGASPSMRVPTGGAHYPVSADIEAHVEQSGPSGSPWRLGVLAANQVLLS
jgi:hypothetical protein